MPRGYCHIERYEKEILKLKENGLTHRQIGEKLGFTYHVMKNSPCCLARGDKRIVSNSIFFCFFAAYSTKKI